MVRTRLVVTLACVLSVATVGCSSNGSPGATGDGITGTQQDFSITLSPTSFAAGDVTFNVTNQGPSTHEFVIVKSDQDPGSFPVEDGEVPEDTLDVVDEIEDIAPNTSQALTVSLDAGSYVVMCNQPDHYQQGMHTGLTVT
jgi:uncharacterized cupredoxin-like copper-binding protein